MSDSYQAVYDAVRSRIHGCDTGAIVEQALRGAFDGVDRYFQCAAQDWSIAASEQMRPSVLYRPKINIDGNQWCALYGDNLQDGVYGFGDTPALAMQDFDKNWASQKVMKQT